jgi:hypothetical protein
MIEISVGRDLAGKYWWIESSDATALARGPFPTKAAAYADAEVTTHGAPCKFTDDGQWERQ